MKYDNIIEIGFTSNEGLYIKPESLSFPYMYRESIEINWEENKKYLYPPKPK